MHIRFRERYTILFFSVNLTDSIAKSLYAVVKLYNVYVEFRILTFTTKFQKNNFFDEIT